MKFSEIATVYGGWSAEGKPQLLSKLFKEDFERIDSAKVISNEFEDKTTGAIVEKTSICLFLKGGNKVFLGLSKDSTLEDGDMVEVNTITLQKLVKDGEVCWKADGVMVES